MANELIFLMLIIRIGSHTASLHDCLTEFCATENLAGKDKYRCEQCKSLNDCQKTLRITRLPEVFFSKKHICIHIHSWIMYIYLHIYITKIDSLYSTKKISL